MSINYRRFAIRDGFVTELIQVSPEEIYKNDPELIGMPVYFAVGNRYWPKPRDGVVIAEEIKYD